MSSVGLTNKAVSVDVTRVELPNQAPGSRGHVYRVTFVGFAVNGNVPALIVSQPGSDTSTAGTFTGNAFAAYNFDTNADETLTVIVDGNDVAITLGANFGDLATAAAGITIAGATIAVDGSFLKITQTCASFYKDC